VGAGWRSKWTLNGIRRVGQRSTVNGNLRVTLQHRFRRIAAIAAGQNVSERGAGLRKRYSTWSQQIGSRKRPRIFRSRVSGMSRRRMPPMPGFPSIGRSCEADTVAGRRCSPGCRGQGCGRLAIACAMNRPMTAEPAADGCVRSRAKSPGLAGVNTSSLSMKKTPSRA
jgi:hypothetical protein